MELSQELERLAGLRAGLAEAEAPLKPMKEEIEITEKAIKEHVGTTGETAVGGGLQVTMSAPRTTYDGHTLHDLAGQLVGSIKSLHGAIWGLSGLGKDDEVERLSNSLEGMTALCERMIGECVKKGAPVVTIRAAGKEKKE